MAAESPPRRSIAIMPPALAQRIAAGEVIERPGSVVRELVENAIDAGAGSIRVDIRGGGLELIAVSDDGHGIPAEELPLAFARHGTSKILSEADLEDVRTLGFRGEALAAIASVATVEAISAVSEGRAAGRLLLQGGEILEQGHAARSPGTTIRVRDLFAAQPARRAALPSRRAEHAYLQSLIRIYALARPLVRLELSLDGRLAFRASGLGEAGALATVFGQTAARLQPFGPFTLGRCTVRGYLGDAGLTRGDRESVLILLNGRWVRPRAWLAALEGAYMTLLPHGRHPIAVLYVEVDPGLADVNRHPAKLEARLLDEDEFLAALAMVVRDRLGNTVAPAGLVSDPLARPRQRGLPPPRRTLRESTEEYGDEPDFVTLRVLGQVFGTAILAEGGRRLYLVDQHRADERALYESLARHDGPAPAQELLEPLHLEAKESELAGLEARLPDLAALGFRVERFGRRAYLVRSQPAALPASAAPALLESLAGGLSEEGDWRDRLLIDVACRSAVKRGVPLTDHEMGELLGKLGRCAVRARCPHGSPIIALVRAEDLVRYFGWP